MSATIHTQLTFMSGVYFEHVFHINSYELDLTMSVETESIREQNIALERIKFFLDDCLQNCIFIHEGKKDVINKYLDADLKICTLPEEPYDQVLALMLLVKLNAITEGRLHVTDISIGSWLSDNVNCLVSTDDNIGPFNTIGWYNENNIKINNIAVKNTNKKIVKLIKQTFSWEDVYLNWEEKDPFITTTPSSEIVFASFDNKTDK